VRADRSAAFRLQKRPTWRRALFSRVIVRIRMSLQPKGCAPPAMTDRFRTERANRRVLNSARSTQNSKAEARKKSEILTMGVKCHVLLVALVALVHQASRDLQTG
jgi:hypothetical protein